VKINCLHGYFIFHEDRIGEVSEFISLFGLPIVFKDDHFTFESLADAPNFSIKGAPYLNTTATKTFAGKVWDVMRENELVYDYDKDLLVPIAQVTNRASFQAAGKYFVSSGLILPGSLTDEGSRVTEYAAWFSTESMRFRYSEVGTDE
jgi:hypothetical protein